MPKVFILLILHLSVAIATAQVTIGGRVEDSATKRPLPFVTVIANGNAEYAIMTDVDGRFELQLPQHPDQLSLHYVGYSDKWLQGSEVLPNSNNVIGIKREANELSEVTILPGLNPADVIMRKVIAYRNRHNPKSLENYQYKKYNKLVVTGRIYAEEDSTINADKLSQYDSVFSTHHLLMTETVAYNYYKNPNNLKEVVEGVKASGFTNPKFLGLANQMQSFSIYENDLQILDRNFVNPTTTGSLRRYWYDLVDTTWEGKDTIWIVRFGVKRGKNFSGLKGVLYVNATDFAISRAILEPAEELAIRMKAEQRYKRFDGKWFPIQHNTDLVIRDYLEDGLDLIYGSKSYIDESTIVLNKPISKTIFDDYVNELKKGANKKDTNYWQENRASDLNEIEQHTYKVIDSIGEEANLDGLANASLLAATGWIPLRHFDLSLTSFFKGSYLEGFSPEIRIRTGFDNNRKVEVVQEYFLRYGFRDKYLKGGIIGEIGNSGAKKLALLYDIIPFDAMPTGIASYLETDNIINNTLLFQNKESWLYNGQLMLGVRIKPWKYLTTDLKSGMQYFTTIKGEQIDAPMATSFYKTQARLRLALFEKKVKIGGFETAVSQPFPILQAYGAWYTPMEGNLRQSFWKLSAQMDYQYYMPIWGKSSFTVSGALAANKAPNFIQSWGLGNAGRIYDFPVFPSFHTMHPNEFITSRQIQAFWHHDFEGRLIKAGNFQPKIGFIAGMLIGDNSAQENVFDLKNGALSNAISPNRGFFETGIIVKDVLQMNFMNAGKIGLGVAGFSRWGAYRAGNLWDDSSARITVSFSS